MSHHPRGPHPDPAIPTEPHLDHLQLDEVACAAIAWWCCLLAAICCAHALGVA